VTKTVNYYVTDAITLSAVRRFSTEIHQEQFATTKITSPQFK